jgi:hypothetical protein
MMPSVQLTANWLGEITLTLIGVKRHVETEIMI